MVGRGCGGRGGRGQGAVGTRRVDAGAVEVHVEPPAVTLVPDAGLLGLMRMRHALSGIRCAMTSLRVAACPFRISPKKFPFRFYWVNLWL